MAANGEEAVELIFRDKPDIMILDMQMPIKDGVVMQEAKRAGVLPYTFVLSGYDEFRYCQQALRLGAKDYLLKPIRSSDILKMLLDAADILFGCDKALVGQETGEKNQLVEIAREYITDHYYEKICLSDVAERIGVTPGYLSTIFQKQLEKYFSKVFKKVKGCSPADYRKTNQNI